MAIKWRKYLGTTNSAETEVSDDNPLPIQGTVTTVTGDTINTTWLDDASATVTYVGKAPVGSVGSAAVWQVFKLDTTTAPLTYITYADGNADFDNVWDDRASLTYS